ncbi:hypothetical protein MRX96_013056 [Rhipicephalus microplus]
MPLSPHLEDLGSRFSDDVTFVPTLFSCRISARSVSVSNPKSVGFADYGDSVGVVDLLQGAQEPRNAIFKTSVEGRPGPHHRHVKTPGAESSTAYSTHLQR